MDAGCPVEGSSYWDHELPACRPGHWRVDFRFPVFFNKRFLETEIHAISL
jgi:hypothetical protein